MAVGIQRKCTGIPWRYHKKYALWQKELAKEHIMQRIKLRRAYRLKIICTPICVAGIIAVMRSRAFYDVFLSFGVP